MPTGAGAVHDTWQDVKAIRDGKKTLEQLAQEKGEEYVAVIIAGNLGKYGIKAGKYGGKWIAGHADDIVKAEKEALDRVGHNAHGPVLTKEQTDSILVLPGQKRPFRPTNPDFPPNKAVVDAMENPLIQKMTQCENADCSEIASKLFGVARGNGKILEVRPSEKGKLTIFENGSLEPGQYYHQVYTDGKYIYDPRLSPSPIPKGDWVKHIKEINPGGGVKSLTSRKD